MRKYLVYLVAFAQLMFASEGYSFEGRHYIGSFKECSYDRLTNLQGLKAAMIEAAKASGATVLSTSDFIFEPNGYTMVALLSESHASIHTYPELIEDVCGQGRFF